MSKANIPKTGLNPRQDSPTFEKDGNVKDVLSDQDYFAEELLSLEESIDRTWQEFEDQRASINEGYRKLEKIMKASNSFKKQYQSLLSFHESHMKGHAAIEEKSQPTDLGELQEKQIQEEAWQERLLKVKDEIESLLQIRKKVGSLFLRLVVGRINMRVWSEKERILLKQEYVKFKWRTNVIFLLFPIVQLLWRYYNRGDGIFSSHFDPNTSYTVEWVLCQWHHGWLLYLYLSLAIREYILRLNGSRIFIWWIYHHHISSLMSFVSILLMRSAYTRFKLIFDYATCLFLLIGLIQMWQNYNSKRRHYARTAMGRAGTLDVSTGETMVELPSSGCEFQCLKVCLYLLYGLEISIGIAIIFYVFAQGYDLPPENRFDLFQFEGYLLGVLTLSIGLGNTFALYTRPKKHYSSSAQASGYSQSNIYGSNDAHVGHAYLQGHASTSNHLASALPTSWSESELDAASSFKSGKISNRLMKGVKLHRFSQESNLATLHPNPSPQTDDEKQQQQQLHHGDKED